MPSLLSIGPPPSDPVTLTLTNVPVDEEHAPQLGQMVEILRTEGDLGDNNLIADNQGFITNLRLQAYSFDTGEIVLADALPADFQNNKYPLFVRLWQASVPFTAGQATPLEARRVRHHRDGDAASLAQQHRRVALLAFRRPSGHPTGDLSAALSRRAAAARRAAAMDHRSRDCPTKALSAARLSVVADCRAPWIPNRPGGHAIAAVSRSIPTRWRRAAGFRRWSMGWRDRRRGCRSRPEPIRSPSRWS